MRTQISVVALATALLAAGPQAQAQLLSIDTGISLGGDSGLGVDLDVGVGGNDGLNVGADVNLGGDSGLGVDADVGLGGDQGLNVDAGVGLGRTYPDSAYPRVLDLNVNAGLGNPGSVGPNGGQLINLDANVGVASQPAPSRDPIVGGVNIAALDEGLRVDALVGLLNTPNLADIDLDAAIDDTRVSVVAVADLLGSEGLVDLTAALQTDTEGRENLLAAITNSDVLSSVLGNEGVDLSDVLAIQVAGDGATQVIVLDGLADIALGGAPNSGDLIDLNVADLADLDIDLLTDDELANIDLALLPNEDQRLEAIIRLLGNQGTPPANGGTGALQIIDLDAVLGEQSLAQLDGVLGGEDGDLVITADILDQIDDLGLSPDAVVAIRNDDNGNTQIFVNAGLGDDGIEVADVEIDLGLGTSAPTTGGPGTGTPGGGEQPGGGTDNGGGTGTGGGGTDNGGGTGTGGGGSNNGGGTGGDTGTGGNGAGTPGTGGPVPGQNGNVAAARPATDANVGLFADLSCELGTAALAGGTIATPAIIARAQSLEVVRVVGCPASFSGEDVDQLRAALENNRSIATTLNRIAVPLDDIVGATSDGTVVTIFVERNLG